MCAKPGKEGPRRTSRRAGPNQRVICQGGTLFMESRACRWVSAGSLRVPATRLARAMHSSLKTCGTLCWGTVQHVRPPVLFFAMHLNKWIFFCFKEGNWVFSASFPWCHYSFSLACHFRLNPWSLKHVGDTTCDGESPRTSCWFLLLLQTWVGSWQHLLRPFFPGLLQGERPSG